MLPDSVKCTFSVIMLHINQRLLRGRKKREDCEQNEGGWGGYSEKRGTEGRTCGEVMVRYRCKNITEVKKKEVYKK